MRKIHLCVCGILTAVFALVFAACPSGVGGDPRDLYGVSLRINGLPAGGNFTAFVLESGTDVSSFTAIISAYRSEKFRAVGVFYSGNVFRLHGLTGMEQDGEWHGSGSKPMLLLNANGVTNDGENPMYRHLPGYFRLSEITATGGLAA